MAAGGPVRVLLVDDHQIFVDGLARLVDGFGGYEVVARVRDGRAALERLRSGGIDIAIVDISMPVLDGLQLVAKAKQQGLAVRWIMLSMHDAPAYRRRSATLGVHVYLSKACSVDDLAQALLAAREGRPWSDAQGGEIARAGATSPLGVVTSAERAILRRLADGMTSKEIADELSLSYRTVQNHRANLCAKLKLRGTNKLLAFAVEHRDSL